ncbi:hypothetical protein Bbelb_380380 [Branchiostoma belcheri]|nr:hypothetical protein Bbelb_380380 [Branchiostoma belcheri]
MYITTRNIPRPLVPVTLGGTTLEVVASYKYLGVTLTNTLSWSKHIDTISTKSRRSAGLLCALRKKVPSDILLRLYKTITRPGLEYANIVWAGLTKSDERKLESVQYQTVRLISGQYGLPYPSYHTLYTQLSLPSLQFRRRFHTVTTLYKLLNGHCPPHLQTLIPRTRASSTKSRYPLRNSNHLTVKLAKTTRGQRTFFHRATSLWNSLSTDARTATTIASFKRKLWDSLGDPYKP